MNPHPGTEIIIGYDGEQAHHKDGPYLAWVDNHLTCEARGHSHDDALRNLWRLYPHYTQLPVIKV